MSIGVTRSGSQRSANERISTANLAKLIENRKVADMQLYTGRDFTDEEFCIHSWILDTIASKYTSPTPIQAACIPPGIRGRSIIGQAQTGSGKSLAFAIIMLQKVDPSIDAVQVLCIAPTRELARMVYNDTLYPLLRAKADIRHELMIPGGQNPKEGFLVEVDCSGQGTWRQGCISHIWPSPDRDPAHDTFEVTFSPTEVLPNVPLSFLRTPQFPPGMRYPHIIVGTPGAVKANLTRGVGSYGDVKKSVKLFVCDEADDLVSGHSEENSGDAITIKSQLSPDVQTLFFSATYNTRMLDFLSLLLTRHDRPKVIKLRNLGDQIPPSILQISYLIQAPPVASAHSRHASAQASQTDVALFFKLCCLREIYSCVRFERSIVYCESKKAIEEVCSLLRDQLRYSVSFLHGDVGKPIRSTPGHPRVPGQPRRRDKEMDDFTSGCTAVLIATDVLARGVNVPEIDLVINFDLPRNKHGGVDPVKYVHRIGRCSRMVNKSYKPGTAVTFVATSDDQRGLQEIIDCYALHDTVMAASSADDLSYYMEMHRGSASVAAMEGHQEEEEIEIGGADDEEVEEEVSCHDEQQAGEKGEEGDAQEDPTASDSTHQQSINQQNEQQPSQPPYNTLPEPHAEAAAAAAALAAVTVSPTTDVSAVPSHQDQLDSSPLPVPSAPPLQSEKALSSPQSLGCLPGDVQGNLLDLEEALSSSSLSDTLQVPVTGLSLNDDVYRPKEGGGATGEIGGIGGPQFSPTEVEDTSISHTSFDSGSIESVPLDAFNESILLSPVRNNSSRSSSSDSFDQRRSSSSGGSFSSLSSLSRSMDRLDGISDFVVGHGSSSSGVRGIGSGSGSISATFSQGYGSPGFADMQSARAGEEPLASSTSSLTIGGGGAGSVYSTEQSHGRGRDRNRPEEQHLYRARDSIEMVGSLFAASQAFRDSTRRPVSSTSPTTASSAFGAGGYMHGLGHGQSAFDRLQGEAIGSRLHTYDQPTSTGYGLDPAPGFNATIAHSHPVLRRSPLTIPVRQPSLSPAQSPTQSPSHSASHSPSHLPSQVPSGVSSPHSHPRYHQHSK